MSTPTRLTREQWIEACAQRYLSATPLGQESAVYFANACADQQTDSHGPDTAEWESPSAAADEDMSYWEDDE